MSLLNIGMSGLAASQSSLATTGNNIANVDTAGYSRQQTVQGTKSSQQYGSVFIGTGTTLADVRRVYNSYLESQLHTATSLNSGPRGFWPRPPADPCFRHHTATVYCRSFHNSRAVSTSRR